MTGYAFCGSFCTLARSIKELRGLVDAGLDVLPIINNSVIATDTRFGRAEDITAEIVAICGRAPVTDIVAAEPLGPKTALDAMIIAPCTGNTLARLAHGITDSAVTMAAKAHLRGSRPLVIALATNDALSANLANIAVLLSRKGVYFVPFGQDDPVKKPYSLVADFTLLPDTLAAALDGRQLQPLLLGKA